MSIVFDKPWKYNQFAFEEHKHDSKHIWTEKYRPKTLDEIVGQEYIVKILKKYEHKPVYEIPPMLFYGSYGLGKTAMSRAFKPKLLTIPFNSAKDRGIEWAREIDWDLSINIPLGKRAFGMISYTDGTPVYDDEELQGFKYIIDEAEQITKEAQIMLRDGFERKGKYHLIILITNDINKIDEGLRERFPLKLQFKPLKIEDMMILARRIIQSENLIISNEDLEKIIKISSGIPRRLIQHLNVYSDTGVLPELSYETDTLNDY